MQSPVASRRRHCRPQTHSVCTVLCQRRRRRRRRRRRHKSRDTKRSPSEPLSARHARLSLCDSFQLKLATFASASSRGRLACRRRRRLPIGLAGRCTAAAVAAASFGPRVSRSISRAAWKPRALPKKENKSCTKFVHHNKMAIAQTLRKHKQQRDSPLLKTWKPFPDETLPQVIPLHLISIIIIIRKLSLLEATTR